MEKEKKDKEKFDEEALLEETEKRMEVLNDADTPADSDDDDVDDDDSTPDDDDQADEDDKDDDDKDDSTPEDDDDEEDDKDDKDDDAKDDGADGGDDEVKLSDAYYRAATNSGYSKDDIVDFMATNPKLAIKTFAKMHDNMNRTSQEFSDFGRAKKKAAEEAANDGGDDNNASKKSTFKKIDTAKLRDEHPDDEGLVDVIEQMQEQSSQMYDQMEELRKAPVAHKSAVQDKLERDQEQLIVTQIDAFFNDSSLAPFASTYGKVSKGAADWSELLPSEKVNRGAVIEQVEQLMEGAKALGREMEVTDALERAHLMITQPIQKKMIREDIMKEVKRKSKGITLRPSSSKSSAKSSKGPKTVEDAVSNAEERMAKLFPRG